MKRIALLLFLIGYLSAQPDLVYNEGALVTIQAGADVYVQGGWVNEDYLGNNAILDQSGRLYLLNGVGGYRGSFANQNGAEANFNSLSYTQVQGDWFNDATIIAAFDDTVEFAGVDEQQYSRGINANVNDEFGYVIINNTALGNAGTIPDRAVGVYVMDGSNNIFKVANTLDFQFGVMSTGTTSEVRILNSDPNAIINYWLYSDDQHYINGRLRRVLNTTGGSYIFPVGGIRGTNLGNGSQGLELLFTSNPNVHNILVWFVSNPTLGSNPNKYECGAHFNQVLNNGLWEVYGYQSDFSTPDNNTSAFTVYNKNHNYTVAAGGPYDEFIVAKDGALGGDTCTVDNSPVNNAGRAGYTTLGGQFYTVYSDPPFPVVNLKLDATGKQDYIAVIWTTDEEINNKGFELQRSTDGINFQKIAWVKGTGTTTKVQGQKYNYNDYDVEYDQVYYYRVKQIDFDGQYMFSNVASAKISTQTEFDAFIYPNPAKNELYLNVTTTRDQTFSLKVYDVIGKLIYTQDIYVEKGKTTLELNELLNRVALGTYYVKITPQYGEPVTTRLVKTE